MTATNNTSENQGDNDAECQQLQIKEDVLTMMDAMGKALGVTSMAQNAGYDNNPMYDSISNCLEVAAEKIRIIADLWEKNDTFFHGGNDEDNQYGNFHLSMLEAEAYLKLLGHYEWDQKIDHVCLTAHVDGLVNRIGVGLENLIPQKYIAEVVL